MTTDRAVEQHTDAPGAAPRVSIVIRCFNEEEHIGRLLDGIGHQTIEPEIIVVDSGSTDRTREIAQAYPVRIVDIEPSEFSFGRALNIGCAEATGRVLVFISAHCYPSYDDWLESLVTPFEEDEQTALVYGKQRGNEVTRFSEHRIFEQWFPDHSDADQRHPFCNNANCAIRRSLWEQHPYDESLTGLEDLGWSKWALSEGLRLRYSAEAEIVHVHDESPSRIHNRYRREAIAFKQLFPEEQFRIRDLTRLLSASVWGDVRHALGERSLHRHLLDITVFRVMQYFGTYRGFHLHGGVESELKRRLYYPHPPRQTGRGYLSSGRRRIPYVDIKGVPR